MREVAGRHLLDIATFGRLLMVLAVAVITQLGDLCLTTSLAREDLALMEGNHRIIEPCAFIDDILIFLTEDSEASLLAVHELAFICLPIGVGQHTSAMISALLVSFASVFRLLLQHPEKFQIFHE